MSEYSLIMVSIFVFMLGLYALLTKKDLFRNMIGLILLTESSHLIFIAFNPLSSLTQFFILTSIIISGCIFAVVLALIISLYRQEGKLDVKILDFEVEK